MNIVKQHVLRGPNLYSNQPCLLTIIDLQELRDHSTTSIEGFNTQLLALLPSLYDHRCSVGQYGGFVQALNNGANLAHVVEHVSIALQCLAGTPTYTGRTHEVSAAPGQYRVVCSYESEHVAIDACDLAMSLVRGLAIGAADLAQQLEHGIAALRDTAERHAIGTSTGAILRAAIRQGIPYQRLTEEANMFVLGWGAQQKRLQATITGDTGHIAVGIACDKQLTKALLQEAGVPVPEGVSVRSLEQAQRAACELGGLVTVKPLDGNHGRGVSTRCGTPDDVKLAFERAREHGRTIIVERYIPGDDYRILVAGERVVAAALRRPAAVVGDGASTVRQLVELENRNPARGEGHTNILTRIPLDGHAETTLVTQGLDFDSVPEAGRRVLMRGNANLSSGGTAEDVTDRLPAETLSMCVRAVRKIGLDVAGIDLVCEDISVPLNGRNGAVIEINAAPGIRMHEYPSAGVPRDAGAAIVESMFGQQDGRIPVIAVTGTNGKTTTTLMIEHVLRQAGIGTGCTTSEGVFINGQEVRKGDCSGYWSARTVLSAPEVEFAVLETARGGILKRGLAFDRCDVSVLLNVSEDHLGMDGVDTLEDLSAVKAVVAQAASRAVVLNAEDARCCAIGAALDEKVERIYFSCEANHPALLQHLQAGGRATWLENGALMACGADGIPQRLLDAAEMPSTLGGCARHNIANGLAATAALMASDLGLHAIAAGLRTFVSDARHNPMRANLYDVNGVQVIVDFAHNPAAFEALAATARAMTPGRTVAVVTSPGDRRERDFQQIGQICGGGFDTAVFYEWNSEHRGRAPGERAAMMQSAAQAARGGKAGVLLETDPAQALRLGLSQCRPGDVLVYACGSSVSELVEALRPVDPVSAARIDATLV
ncbi:MULTISPECIES: cyanophycin synthetase [unclassified Duganella]|uniref:cyanophycin synthetase n=1 Tax=unclassified Duganella TaxID=2636909 RepID=UPI00088709C7|nr:MULTISPECIES: cyanophycin synthetase [unclassified Duganella]SDG43003.1 cyanophycin synthetase [Duganella sp. OV458]SDJ60996.1 cyanophycin synthetase [Duganella sp. OV510]